MTEIALSFPFDQMQSWIEKEKELGSINPDRIVLATTSLEGLPHSRIVAMREITSEGIIFFTQRGSRKVAELLQHPYASMTLWLPLQQRQVVLEGLTQPLSQQENERYWKMMPYERQLLFSAYSPTSGQPLSSMTILENKRQEFIEKFGEVGHVPSCEYYCGFHFIAETLYFYTLGSHSFSESLKYERHAQGWKQQLLSP